MKTTKCTKTRIEVRLEGGKSSLAIIVGSIVRRAAKAKNYFRARHAVRQLAYKQYLYSMNMASSVQKSTFFGQSVFAKPVESIAQCSICNHTHKDHQSNNTRPWCACVDTDQNSKKMRHYCASASMHGGY